MPPSVRTTEPTVRRGVLALSGLHKGGMTSRSDRARSVLVLVCVAENLARLGASVHVSPRGMRTPRRQRGLRSLGSPVRARPSFGGESRAVRSSPRSPASAISADFVAGRGRPNGNSVPLCARTGSLRKRSVPNAHGVASRTKSAARRQPIANFGESVPGDPDPCGLTGASRSRACPRD